MLYGIAPSTLRTFFLFIFHLLKCSKIRLILIGLNAVPTLLTYRSALYIAARNPDALQEVVTRKHVSPNYTTDLNDILKIHPK